MGFFRNYQIKKTLSKQRKNAENAKAYKFDRFAKATTERKAFLTPERKEKLYSFGASAGKTILEIGAGIVSEPETKKMVRKKRKVKSSNKKKKDYDPLGGWSFP